MGLINKEKYLTLVKIGFNFFWLNVFPAIVKIIYIYLQNLLDYTLFILIIYNIIYYF